MKYFEEIMKSMTWLGEKSDTFFVGQAVQYEGTAMYNTLKNVPNNKRLELPVFEESQCGISTGMALNGTVPISIFPRFDFLILATNQLVNHLNRLPEYSDGEFKPKVILRSAVGSRRPLDPQGQHRNDYTEAFRLMLNNMEVIKLEEPKQIFESYVKSYERTDGKSTLLIEVSDYYNEK